MMRIRNGFTNTMVAVLFCTFLSGSLNSLAYTGSMGYEGGISAADPFEDGTYSYREVCFLTGVPIIVEGTMTVKKNMRQGKINTTYTYNLVNNEQNATVTRVIVTDTITTTKENGQTTESSTISRRPTEIVRVGENTYNLSDYRFSRSGITDPKPAVLYNAGEYQLEKIYNISSGGTVTIEMNGTQYGYDQYWSSAKSGSVNVYITAEPQIDGVSASWGGYASVTVASNAKKGFQYIENEPWQISFEGGYVEQNWNESVLEYEATLPEFDKSGKATEVLTQYSERFGLDTEPINTRLMVPDLKHLKGHWAEEPVKILFSLEVIPGAANHFNPGAFITRRDFAAMVVRAIKDIPQDPDLVTRTTTTKRPRKNEPESSPFTDITPDDPLFSEIITASTRGIIQGTGNARFSPDKNITSSEAVTMLIRALGLEGLATYPDAITPFVDNDEIPSYARNAAAVAWRIGLIEGDNRGYFHPKENLTYERASMLIYRLIQYMGDELVKDYRERLLNY